ncbi:sigma 54-interacting transcriptional regulator [Engelhardtia mirabilis]|uniref:Transcriptional regulatory protein ZraR n=1 Tax=Engelhardtia mirabilis TaxID=2528011 RepID=A0A518BMX1_9BACT|nr:Transcriptional regulatory protein ZraR [Planctomycetes bacterium Pla133]QDV02657.1 Transcriptional regulatory protein ZraR [Planctomycetes bacterium Pla86]
MAPDSHQPDPSREQPTEAAWPAGYTAVEPMARRDGAEVWRARRGSDEVALRLVSDSSLAEAAAELEVLSTLRLEGTARLVDHGRLEDGRTFLAREWIDGIPLEQWASGRTPEAIGRLLADLTDGLEALHRAGFAHGDLSAVNVLVTAGDRPVLVDFGLSGAIDAERAGVAATGTLYAIAPERLAGSPPSPAADLFALGALAHELLVPARRTAREFYSQFPSRPFLEASGTSVDDLPDWARETVEALVARRPEARPAGAAAVGRALRTRLGLEAGASILAPLRVPTSLGREAFLRWIVDGFEPAPHEALAIALPAGDDPRAVLEALRLRATIAGIELDALELSGELAALGNGAAMDHWAAGHASDLGRRWLAVSMDEPSALAAAAVDRLARSRKQSGGDARLLVVGTALGQGASGWRVEHAPAVRARELAEHLDDLLDAGSQERLERLADQLVRASKGAPAAIERLLRRAQHEGWIVDGGDRWRLRPGPLPDLARWSETDLDPPAEEGLREILLALAMVPGSCRLDALAQVVGAALSTVATRLAHLSSSRWVRWEGGEVALVRDVDAIGLLDRGRRQMIARRWSDVLDSQGASRAATWHLRWLARSVGQDDVLLAEWHEQLHELRDSGSPEFALAGLHVLESLAGDDAPADLAVERALCWAQLGDARQAADALGAYRPSDAPGQARGELARAQIARIVHDEPRASAHFDRAVELDPGVRLEAELGRVQMEFARGEDAALIERVDRLQRFDDGTGDRTAWRTWCDLGRLRAVARGRRGQVDAARSELDQWLAEACARGDDAAVGTLSMNLATIERRTGSHGRSIALFASAAAALRSAGRIANEANARGQLGGALREGGDLMAAEPELARALAVRERLGDEAGAATLRGLFALLTAERGHAGAAIADLERAVEGLSAGQRRLSAPLLLARSDLQRARIGRDPLGSSELSGEAAVDPRVFLDQGRAAALRGHTAEARAFVGRGAELARRLDQVPVEAEARFLARVLEGEAAVTDGVESDDRATGLLAEDLTLWNALVAGDVATLANLARQLASRGRDDRAARAWLAVAARSDDPELAEEAASQARDHLERCAVGLSQRERFALRRTLLNLPDPRPRDLDERSGSATDDEELEMEIMQLLALNHRLAGQEDLDGLLTEIVDSACQVTGAERGFLVLEEGGQLRLDAATEFARGDVAASDVSVSTSIVGEALASMKTLNVSNAADDPERGRAPSIVEHELRSILCAPFRATEDLRGVVVVDHRLRTGAFGPRAERLLGLLADQAALAVGQLRRREQIHDLNKRLSERVVRQERDLEAARKALQDRGLESPGSGLVGSSKSIETVRALISKAAPSGMPVLLRGESGTGKELAARAVHEQSERHAAAFVSENVAALPASLIESELFGYRRGAFTGADTDRAGLFERAHGGTLFLDEIGEMPLELQAKLLRVLETRRVRRLGDGDERSVDFRLVTATHRDLEAAVGAGSFRQDLYYRIGGIEVRLPSLAERAEDIPELVEHFLTLLAASTGERRHVSSAVLERLTRRPWPGNVRELRNEVRRLCVLSEGEIDDPSLVGEPTLGAAVIPATGPIPTMAEIERAAIERAVAQTGGDKREAARLLGISRAKVYQRIKEWREEVGGDASAID